MRLKPYHFVEMFFKKIKYIPILLIILIVFFFVFLAVNFDSRRSIFTKLLVVHDFYRIKTITSNLQNRNFPAAAKKLNNYIKFSKRISYDKNYMMSGIYEATKLAASRATTQEDYNYLENIFKKLIDIDNRVYKPHVWYARALSDNDIGKSLDHLKIAIEISPSESDAYREILRISQNTKDPKLASKYCEVYYSSLLGGNLPIHFDTLFGSFNNNKFAIKLVNKSDKFTENYLPASTSLNKNQLYEFLPTEVIDSDGFNLYFSPLVGLKINLKKIYYHSDNKIFELNTGDITITSKSSFIEDSNDTVSVFLIPKINETIRIRHKNFQSIKKIDILMDIKKMGIANNNLCQR